jgi:16S rRNA G966 N2-methylase RsmD
MTITSAEHAAADYIEAHLMVRGSREGLYELSKSVSELKELTKTSRLPVVALLQLFPERFVVELMLSDRALLGVRLADSIPAAKNHLAADAALVDKLRGTLLQYHAHRPSHSTEPVPLSWLLRSMPSPIEAWMVSAADSSLLFHQQPTTFGYANRSAAWSGSVRAHMQRFVTGHTDAFVWHANRGGAIALTKAEVTRLGGEQEEQAQPPSSLSLHVTERLLAQCASGGEVLIMRASTRTSGLFSAELHTAALLSQLPPEQLVLLIPGLWLLRHGSNAEATARFHSLLPHLAGMRSRGDLLAIAPSSEALLALLSDEKQCTALRHRVHGAESLGVDSLDAAHWSLRFEQHHPSADQHVLPFNLLDSISELTIALYSALGGTYCTSDSKLATAKGGLVLHDPFESVGGEVGHGVRVQPAAGACARLTLLQAKGAVLLLRQMERSKREQPISSPYAANVPPWITTWERRSFAFSASLHPYVALAAVNIAIHTHLRRRGITDATGIVRTAQAFRVFDPCIGSGTVLAAAAARGCSKLLGSDLNHDFVSRSECNLREAGIDMSTVQLVVHDATEACEVLQASAEQDSTVIVSNPPWGHNIGEADDGVAIVRSIAAQARRSTMCWIVNPLAAEALRCMPSLTVLRQVPFWRFELVVCVTDGQASRDDLALPVR